MIELHFYFILLPNPFIAIKYSTINQVGLNFYLKNGGTFKYIFMATEQNVHTVL